MPSLRRRAARSRPARSRAVAFALVAACYLLAGLVAAATVVAVLSLAPGWHPIAVTLAADVAATVAVFAASTVLANASLYDPYWSVAPPAVAFAWAALPGQAAGARQALVLVLVAAWAVRLTLNWAAGWRGLHHEDWRYADLRASTAGRLPWWVVNLGGIQLMPTIVVFGGLLSLWPALVAGDRPLGPLDALAAGVTAAAIAVEAVADRQVRRFTADPANAGRPVDRGLWAWSRHPNYLGEICFWWGLWLFGLAAAPGWWWTVVGPLGMVALFQGVSIPLMERRTRRRRPGYAQVVAGVPRLVPRPWRRARHPR